MSQRNQNMCFNTWRCGRAELEKALDWDEVDEVSESKESETLGATLHTV